QTFLLGVILLPLRALLVGLIILLAWPFAAVSTACCPEKLTHPVTDWRRKITQPALIFLGRAMFFSMGFIVTRKGNIASPLEAPIFVVAPHSTFFDGIACVVAGLPSLLSRNENAQVPLIGRLLRAVQPVLVSRVDPDSRKNTINEIIKRATSGGEWPQILVFPEGTCTNRSCLITFKPGAFIPGVPVQPILLRYPNKLDTVTWTWQGYTFLQLCVLTFCQPFTKVEVEFMPVQVPSDEEKKDPVLFASRVRNLMADFFNLPVTDHTYEDCRLMISAGQLTLPMEAGLVEFTKISQKLKLDWDGIRKHLDEYASIASSSKGGRIGIEEFAEYLKLPVSDVLRQLFALFDRWESVGTSATIIVILGPTLCLVIAATKSPLGFMEMLLLHSDGAQTGGPGDYAAINP
ncbi:Lysophosphatidylcholine acyltransferase 2, partial [Fukomys damarensis]